LFLKKKLGNIFFWGELFFGGGCFVCF